MTKLIAFDGSIFAGWNGKSQELGLEVTNTAISGAQFDNRDRRKQRCNN